MGAGGGSVAVYMRERAGPDAHVVATDINTDWMGESMPSDVEIRRHDIGVDPLPEATFDVIHARAVLTFVPQRRSALTRMLAALKPGGWILIEEMVPPFAESLSQTDDPDVHLAHKIRHAVDGDHPPQRRRHDVSARHSAHPRRRRTPRHRRRRILPALPHVAVADLTRANIDQLEFTLVDSGLVSAAELDRYRTLLVEPELFYPASMALISVWGRRELA